MKRTLLFFLALLLTSVMARATGGVTLHGVTTDIKDAKYNGMAVGGIVEFAPADPLQLTTEFDDSNYGILNFRETICQYVDNKLYVYRYKQGDYGLKYVRFYVYRCNDGVWSLDMTNDMHELEASYTAYPTAMTYNPQTQTLYGIRPGSQGQIYKIDTATGKMTLHKQLPMGMIFNSVATDSKGVTYATSYDGKLYTVDLETAETKEIGALSTYASDVMPSVITPDGKLYVYVPNGNNGRLFEINKETAAATLVTTFSEENVGNIRALYATSEGETADTQTPDICSGVKIEPTAPGALTVKLKATAPTLAFDKKTALTGKVNIKFYVDGGEEPVATVADVEPGKEAAADYTFATEGTHSVKAVAVNDNGEGAALSAEAFVGFDTPVAPTDVKFVLGDNLAYTVTWTAPTEGVNGGAVDSQNMTFNVTLQPDGKTTEGVKGNSLTGTLPSDIMKDYYFSVVAVTGDKTSQPATSNHIKSGKAFDIPYGQYFNTQEDYDLHTVIDKNGGATWSYGNDMDDGMCATYNGNAQTEAADDWLISPPLNLHKGATYTVKVKASSAFNQSQGNNLGLFIGSDPSNTDGFTRIGYAANIPDYVDGGKVITATYTATEDFTGYLGLQCTSAAKRRMFVSNYEITGTAATGAPAAVTALEVTPGDEGALTATIAFNAPSETVEGTALTSLKAIKIYRDGSLSELTSIDNPAPGAALTYTDETPTQGSHSYKIVPVGEAGAGAEASATTWVGEDLPGNVTELTVTQDADNLYLEWTEPSASKQGYYLNFDKLTYTVYYQYGQMEIPSTYQEKISGTKLTIPKSYFYKMTGGAQMLLTLYVNAQSSAGSGMPAYQDEIIGNPYSLPFDESFEYGYTKTAPWGLKDAGNGGLTYVSAWFMARDGGSSPTKVTSYDNDGGLAVMYQTAYDSYSQRLLSPIISIDGAKNPVVSFYMYHRTTAGEGNTLQVEAAVGDEYTSLGELINLGGSNGWQLHEISLKNFTGKELRLSFCGTTTKGTDLCIDKVTVSDNPESSIGSAAAQNNVFSVGSGRLTFGTTGSAYAVYDLAGRVVKAGKTVAGASVNLKPGCYVVKTDGQTKRIIVKR